MSGRRQTFGNKAPGFAPVRDARVLVNVRDFITTDHISPAGSIAPATNAAIPMITPIAVGKLAPVSR